MNLSYLSFYRQYLNSPITKLHHINKILKICIIFGLLIIIPYMKSKFIIQVAIFLTLLLITLDSYSITILILIKYIYFLIFYIIFYLINYNNISVKIKKYYNIFFYIPLNIQNFFFLKNINQISIKYFHYLIPKFIVRIIGIKFIYFILLKLLFTTVKYESIIMTILLLITTRNRFNYIHYNKFNLVLSFTFHFLERVICHLQIIYLSIQLNYMLSSISYYNFRINTILIMTCISNIYKDIYSLASILWSRNIFHKTFYLLSIF